MGGHATPRPAVSSFSDPTLGSLRYNTSQAGSVVPIVIGTQQVSVNLLEFFNYNSTGDASLGFKGGKGGHKGAGKKRASAPPTFTVFIVLSLCQGPVSFNGSQYSQDGHNRVWANAGIGYGWGAAGLTNFAGSDGQDADANLVGSPNQPILGYSGVALLTGAPLNMGSSPAIPNVSGEIGSFGAGTAGDLFPDDASPAFAINFFLTDARLGVGFPSSAIDQGLLADFQLYCRVFKLAISMNLNRAQPVSQIIEGICQMTVTAPVWSGGKFKLVPYANYSNSLNGEVWNPDLTVQHTVDDDSLIPFGGDSDPVQVIISDATQITNWLSLEYLDRQNSYNNNIQYDFDQASIDAFGVKPSAVSEAHMICNPTTALVSCQLQLARMQGIRTTYKFQLGWSYARLEPMDIIAINDPAAGLSGMTVRITAKEEDDNNVLVFTAEELSSTSGSPYTHPTQNPNPVPVNVFVEPGTAL